MRKLLKLNLHSRRICFLVETQACCGEIVTEHERFSVEVHKDSINPTCSLIIYDIFDTDDEGKMCVLLDDAMKELCSGRYIFRIMLDECLIVKDVKFLWGGRPIISDINVESNSAGECYDETGSGDFTESALPDACCTECGDDSCQCDVCASCCDKCACPVELCDPEELLKRDC